MQLDELMSKLAERLQLAPFPRSADGSFDITVDERFVVRCAAGERGVVELRATIAPLPLERGERQEVLRRLLELSAQSIWRERSVPALTASEELVLQLRLSGELSPASFETSLETFINDLVAWSEVIERPQRPSPLEIQRL